MACRGMKDEKATILCLQCDKQARCQVCRKRSHWSKRERNNHKSKQCALVCAECRQKGYTPKDTQSYRCRTCKKEYGAKQFRAADIKHVRASQVTSIACSECVRSEESITQRLQIQLRSSRRRCTCYCPIHRSTCPLTPVTFGEKRWPGSDGAISAADRSFLDSLVPQPLWWTKAWGR